MNRFTHLFLAFVSITFGLQFPSTRRGAEMEPFTGEKHICGSEDPWLGKNTLPAEKQYRELGREMKVVIERDKAHLSTTPAQPAEVVDFIMNSIQSSR
jgi:hypothetical protein